MSSAAAVIAPSTGGMSVRALARPVAVLAARTPVPEVESRFRADRGLRAVVTSYRGQWQLLTRAHLADVLSGPYGYGRALLERRQLRHLLPLRTLVVPAGLPLAAVAERVLARVPMPSDVVVVDDDGSVATAAVSDLFAALAEGYRGAALTDTLTGLPNRLALAGCAAGLGSRRGALLYVDLDRFKPVNDTYGHRAGDAVLREFAARLRSCTRSDDVVARVGGDEFVVLLVDADEVHACAVAERVVLTAAAPFVVDGRLVSIGASVGVALGAGGEEHLSAVEVLMRHADAAMYRAKRAGRSQWARLDAAGRDVGPPLGRRLRAAIDDGRLALHYQPKTRLRDGRVFEVEALCRWSEPDLGSISPDTFIPLAEQLGLIDDLGAWVLERACRQAREWADLGHDIRVAVNISAVQLARPELVDEVRTVLARTGLPAQRLRLEITETAAITEPAATVARLHRLAAAGVLLSLDDFGTGYSSLSLLRSLPVHGLKIDKSFVDRIDTTPDDAAMVEMVVQLAHRLGLTVIAEGVERCEQLEALRAMGCDAVQGFLLGAPVPPEQLAL